MKENCELRVCRQENSAHKHRLGSERGWARVHVGGLIKELEEQKRKENENGRVYEYIKSRRWQRGEAVKFALTECVVSDFDLIRFCLPS